jgi:hypothetical protein
VEEDVNRQSSFVSKNSKLSTHNSELPSMQLTGSIEALQESIGRLRKNSESTLEFTSLHVWDNRSRSRRMLKKAVQQGRSE